MRGMKGLAKSHMWWEVFPLERGIERPMGDIFWYGIWMRNSGRYLKNSIVGEKGRLRWWTGVGREVSFTSVLCLERISGL